MGMFKNFTTTKNSNVEIHRKNAREMGLEWDFIDDCFTWIRIVVCNKSNDLIGLC